jgi:hypothetical protein
MMADGGNTSEKTIGATVIFKAPTLKRRGPRPINEPKRIHARAIGRILDRKTGEVVGWLYEWNTGERVPRWKSGPRKDVIFT